MKDDLLKFDLIGQLVTGKVQFHIELDRESQRTCEHHHRQLCQYAIEREKRRDKDLSDRIARLLGNEPIPESLDDGEFRMLEITPSSSRTRGSRDHEREYERVKTKLIESVPDATTVRITGSDGR